MEFQPSMEKNEKGAWIGIPISDNTYIICSLILLPNKREYEFYISENTSYNKDEDGYYTRDYNTVEGERKKKYREKYYDKLKNYFENE